MACEESTDGVLITVIINRDPYQLSYAFRFVRWRHININMIKTKSDNLILHKLCMAVSFIKIKLSVEK